MGARHPRVAKRIKKAAEDKKAADAKIVGVDFAAAIGVTQSTASRILAGDSSPDPILWPVIEDLLDIPAGELATLAPAKPVRRSGPVSTDARVTELSAQLKALTAQVQRMDAELRTLRAGSTKRSGRAST